MVETKEPEVKKGQHGGPRPGAGRPSAVDSQILAGLAMKACQWATDSWDELSEESRLRITIAFGAKYIPQKVEQSGSLDMTLTEIKSSLDERLKCLDRN
jgi:hypothetical protein